LWIKCGENERALAGDLNGEEVVLPNQRTVVKCVVPTYHLEGDCKMVKHGDFVENSIILVHVLVQF
jgi:hypothetical protein